MKIDLLILQLALIFLPGIVWARLDASYAAKTKLSDVEFFVRAFLFGLASYVVVFAGFSLAGKPFVVADLADSATRPIVTRDVVLEILWALGAGVLLAVVWLYASTYKIITWALQKIKATKKYGDEDVWDFTFNSRQAAVEYIHFRDFENKLVYAGWVNTFSETDKIREIVLRDVIVYDFEGVESFRVPLLYLARAPENIHIEFPYQSAASQERTNDH